MASATAYVAEIVLPGPRVVSSEMCNSRGYAERYLAWLRHREEQTGARVVSATVRERAVREAGLSEDPAAPKRVHSRTDGW